MKNYTKPEIKINVLNNVDVVLAASGGINTANFNKNGKKYTAINF